LYRLWWEEAETELEEQKLEIHRLALLSKEEKKVAEVASRLVHRWWNQSRFREAVQLCKSTLEITEDYRLLKVMGFCESQVGELDRALEHYEQALSLCPLEDKAQQSALKYCLGRLKMDRGEIEEATALYQQSLAICEQIGDAEGKAVNLN
jgi:tetratricopeptide (TPR) repeat protein